MKKTIIAFSLIWCFVTCIYANFTKFLPYHTLAVVSENDPLSLLQQIACPEYLATFRAKTLEIFGSNLATQEDYENIGLNLNLSVGCAITGIQPDKETVHLAFFLGVAEKKIFQDFLLSAFARHSKQIEVVEKTYSSDFTNTSYFILVNKNEKNEGIVLAFLKGYAVLYTHLNWNNVQKCADIQDLEKSFQQDFLENHEHLEDNDIFLSVWENLEEKSCLTLFVSVRESLAVFNKIFFPETLQNILEKIQAIGLATKLEKDLTIYSCIISEKLSSYQNKGSCRTVLGEFPADPILFLSGNVKISQIWQDLHTDSASWLLHKFGFSNGKIAEIISTAEKFIEKHLSISISLQEVFLNLQGNMAFALYPPPTPMEGGIFDFAFASKLNEPEKMQNFLRLFFQKAGEKVREICQFIQINKLEGTTYFSINHPSFQKFTPTLGIYEDYLLFTSRKEIFQSILLGKNNGFFDSFPPIISSKMRMGSVYVGYAHFPKLCNLFLKEGYPFLPCLDKKNLLNPVEKEIQEVIWYSEYIPQGIQSYLNLKTKSKLFSVLLEQLFGKEIKNAETEIDQKNSILYYDFDVIVLSGSRYGERYKGSFSYDSNLLKGQDEEIIDVLDIQFEYGNIFDRTAKVKCIDGQLRKLCIEGGPSYRRFGINDGFELNQIPHDWRPNYFGYLDRNRHIDGFGLVRYFKRKLN